MEMAKQYKRTTEIYMKNKKEKLFRCTCGLDIMGVEKYDDWGMVTEKPINEYWFSFYSGVRRDYRGFFQRIVPAIKFVLGTPMDSGEVVLRNEDIVELREFLKEE